jgi:single-stranded DNA-binding protein
MSELKRVGKITKIGKVNSGTSKNGTWKNVEFIVDSGEKYNNIYPFVVFGEDKVDNFVKYNKVGQTVEVDFNIASRSYQDKNGDERFSVSLQAWKVFVAGADSNKQQAKQEVVSDLPF